MEKFKQHDWIITFILIILGIFSILLIFSTTYNASNPQEGQGTVYRQLIFYAIGFVFYFLMSNQKIGWLKEKNIVILIYGVTLLALIYVLLFTQERANTQRWIFLGPFSLQPAEYAKIALIIATAYIFGNDSKDIGVKKYSLDTLLKKVMVSAASAGALILLVFLQPSLGNALIILAIWLCVIFIATPVSSKIFTTLGVGLLAVLSYFQMSIFSGIAAKSFLGEDMWKLFTMVALFVIFAALYYLFKFQRVVLASVFIAVLLLAPAANFTWNNVMKEYHRDRVTSYAEGFNGDPTGRDYQVRQSMIAIGAGQFSGRGFLRGTQSTLKTLPFAHTDFIFAALAEQFGFIGILVLFSTYALLFVRILQTAMKTTDEFSKLICMGVIAVIVVNIFINTSMNMGLMPVTGVPLPLISHGGSSVLVVMIALGLVQMVNNSMDSRDVTEKFTWNLQQKS